MNKQKRHTPEEIIRLLRENEQPTDVAELKAMMKEAGSSFISQMMAVFATDSQGKEIDRAEPIGFDGEVSEADFQKRMFERARTTLWPIDVTSLFRARESVSLEA